MKNDINLKRVFAFTKRLMQVALQLPPQYACGCLFLLSEVLKAKPPLWKLVLQKEFVDDELEHFEDILEDQEMHPTMNSKLRSSVQNGKDIDFMVSNEDSNFDKENSLNNGPRVKGDNDAGLNSQSLHGASLLPSGYDPRLREPLYCNADRTCLWELSILASHVHPSVATMARTLLSGAHIVYNGDPLNDLSIGAFLDNFMEKKLRPNKTEGIWHGGSQIAPAKKLDMSHGLIGDEILQLAEEEVPPEDVVFHRFYLNKTSSSRRRRRRLLVMMTMQIFYTILMIRARRMRRTRRRSITCWMQVLFLWERKIKGMTMTTLTVLLRRMTRTCSEMAVMWKLDNLLILLITIKYWQVIMMMISNFWILTLMMKTIVMMEMKVPVILEGEWRKPKRRYGHLHLQNLKILSI